MRIHLLAGAACAALMGLVLPAKAATLPNSPLTATARAGSTDQAVATFYTHRNGAPLWVKQGDVSGARHQPNSSRV